MGRDGRTSPRRGALALTLLAAACGSDGAVAPPTPAPTAPPPVASAQPPTQAIGPATPDDDACAFDGPIPEGAWTPAGAASHDVGAFRVTLDGAGALTVTHAEEPGKTLYATAGARLLRAARPELHVEEHQGSFAIDDRDILSCDGGRVAEVAAVDDRLLLRGAFEGGETCAKLRFTIGLCEARRGHLVFDAYTNDDSFSALTLEARSEADERVYGLGEQFPHDSLDLKGRRFPILAQEGGVGRGHQPISAAVNAASAGSAGSQESTYYAAPHVLTSKLRSFFLENTELAVFDLTDRNVLRVRTHAPRVRARILEGKSPLELIERFTEYAGRMPPPPRWLDEGAIVALARPVTESLALVDKLRAGGVQIAAVWNQTWPGKATTFIGEQVLWNWAYNPNAHPGWLDYVDALAERNIRTLCYVNSMFREVPDDARPVARDTFAEGLARGAFVLGEGGSPLKLPVTAFDVTLLDLSKPDARTWMKALLKEEMLTKARCSGWMADFAEALPFDAKLASGATGAAYHNAYPVEWARLQRELVEESGLLGEVLVWNRSGHTKSPSASMLLWEGDQLTTWDKYDGLVSALHGLLGGGFSGIALNHSDTGGYTSLTAGGVGYSREREQLERWAELSAFTAVLRTHEGNQPGANAQVYDDEGIAHFARMTKLYKALAPYRRTLFAEAEQKGWPVVRHLALHYPDDPTSWTVDDELLLGSEILVAPIKNKCFTSPLCPYDKETYLPPGRWVHLWTDTVHGDPARGTRVTIKAPRGQPVALYREGSAVGAELVLRLKAAGLR